MEEECPTQLSHVLAHVLVLLVDQATNDRHWFDDVLANANDFTPW